MQPMNKCPKCITSKFKGACFHLSFQFKVTVIYVQCILFTSHYLNSKWVLCTEWQDHLMWSLHLQSHLHKNTHYAHNIYSKYEETLKSRIGSDCNSEYGTQKGLKQDIYDTIRLTIQKQYTKIKL